MSAGNAKIGQPAPDFSATAVVNGEFKDIKLSDYKGNEHLFLIGFVHKYQCRYLQLFPTTTTTSLVSNVG